MIAERTILVVTHGGIEVELLVSSLPRSAIDLGEAGVDPLQRVLDDKGQLPWTAIHVAQSWKPMRCSCGLVHPIDAPAFFVISVGVPRDDVRCAQGAVVVEVVPSGTPSTNRASPQIVHHGALDFGPWAAAVIRNLTLPMVGGGGFVGWGFEDLATLLSVAGRWHCFEVAGQGVDVVEQILADPAIVATAGVHIVFAGGAGIRLSVINDLAVRLSEALPADASLIFAGELDPTMAPGMLLASVLVADCGGLKR